VLGRCRAFGFASARTSPTPTSRLPVTTVPITLLDYAATASVSRLRRALAEAEYLKLLDLDAVVAELGRGRRGSSRLRRALSRHEPRLARTRSGLERLFFAVCESAGLPLPEVNVRIAGMTVDALWRRERVIVEIDGHGATIRRPRSNATDGGSSVCGRPVTW
jgi:hypothetical protein